MTLKFRNIEVTPEDPVEQWGVEGILTALERGNLNHWGKIIAAAKSNANVMRDLKVALKQSQNQAVARWLGWQLEPDTPELRVARQLQYLRLQARLSQREFAERLGTSPSRMSTYLAGKVMPSADFMYRAEEVARSRT